MVVKTSVSGAVVVAALCKMTMNPSFAPREHVRKLGVLD
jgi:hypothetical protein